MSKTKGTFDPTAVSMALLAAELGGSAETAEYWTRKVGAEPVEDWRGARSLRAADARRVLEAHREAREAHDRDWAGYQAWLQAQRGAAREERDEDFRRKRLAVEVANTGRRRTVAERALKEREAVLAAEVASQPVAPSFEEWKRTASRISA